MVPKLPEAERYRGSANRFSKGRDSECLHGMFRQEGINMRKIACVGRKPHTGNGVRTENSSHLMKLTHLTLSQKNGSLAVGLASCCFSRAFCFQLETVLWVFNSRIIIITRDHSWQSILKEGNGRETL